MNLEATKALTWVVNIAGINYNEPGAVNTAPLELGYRAQDLVDAPGTDPRALQRAFPADLGRRRSGRTCRTSPGLTKTMPCMRPPVSPMSGSTCNRGGRAP